MAGSMQSILDKILSQIRGSQGGGSQGGGSQEWGSFRPMTDQERLQRGIDPRDPNTYKVDNNGRVMTTYIGWNPNNQVQDGLGRSVGDPMDSGLWNNLRPDGNSMSKSRDWYTGGDGGGSGDLANMVNQLAGQMSGGRGGSVRDALDAANKAAGGGRPNFSRPIRNLPNGASLENLAGDQANKAIPKAKPNLQRVSPGMYRNAKGDLVRK